MRDRPGALGCDTAPAPTDDTAIVETIAAICEEAIAVGFAYVAVILEAWSRRVVGYPISRSIDARLTMAALKSASRRRTACIRRLECQPTQSYLQ